MQVVLVHHAEAAGPDVDPQRPLTTRGHQQADALAERARAAGVAPAAIWHSGKLRARQTGEPFLRLNPFAEFKMMRGLRPDDPPEMARDLLLHETRPLLIVGHMPQLPALLRMLTGDAGGFPLHGMVALESDASNTGWKELWRV
jgi:phosphohistidine phosphatase